MNKLLACLAVGALGLLSACSSVPNKRVNYAPPSVGKVQSSVGEAQTSNVLAKQRVTSAQTRATAAGKRITAAAAQAKTITEKLTVIAKAVEPQPEVRILVLQVQGHVDTLTQELLAAQDEVTQLQADLVEANLKISGTTTALASAQTAATVLQTEVTKQTDLLNESNRQLNAAIIQGKKDKHNAHVFKFIIIGCASALAGLAVFAVFRVAAFAPPLLYLLLGAPAAVGTFLFFFLG